MWSNGPAVSLQTFTKEGRIYPQNKVDSSRVAQNLETTQTSTVEL